VLVSEEGGLQKDGTCVQLESDMVVCQNCDDHVSDGAHKLVFVVCSGDTQEVSASDVVLICGTEEALDVGMEQLVQDLVVELELCVDIKSDVVENKEQLVNEEEFMQHEGEATEEYLVQNDAENKEQQVQNVAENEAKNEEQQVQNAA
jgi:hypothetical protein